MPTPVACLLNRPWTTFSLVFSGASGSRLLLSSISAPAPLAPQWFGLMPLPMNSAAKRWGYFGVAASDSAVSPPQTGIDSSHGSAIATPTPRSTVRRLSRVQAGIMNGFSRDAPIALLISLAAQQDSLQPSLIIFSVSRGGNVNSRLDFLRHGSNVQR